jgi:hypothetical protein
MDKTLKQYHLVNNVIGWLIGIIACVVYIMTAEATASWWDCGEYIATAYKVQVGHPPGAPTFQILGRLFSLFSDPYHAAFAVNVLSAISSGLGIMFLYWTITLLAKKLLKPGDLALNNTKVWAVFASGIVGSLAYTFTDTYWFSAVEGEVYAMSSFFTAVVFWAILKWDEQSEDKHSMRWLILISFLVGIAIGVHLLNLLTIPAIVYVVYFKKYPKTTLKGFLVSGGISLVLLAVVLWGVIPGIVNLSSDFDVFFVNKLHMGFNTGTVVFFLIIACFVAWGIWNNSHFNRPSKAVNVTILVVMFALMLFAKMGAGTFSFGYFVVLLLIAAAAYYIVKGKNRVVTNAAILSFLMLVVGYSTFFILVIRANTNTPLNENAPKDAVAMRAYLGREQYGQTPFLTGPYYTAGNPIGSEKDYAKYIRTQDEEGRDFYKVAAYAQKFVYNENHTGIFPRMYSPDAGRKHPTYYRYWAGDPPVGSKPTFAQNLTFFHRYQLGWMYWRYFMWNFAGRQNDIQGHHFDDNEGMQGVHFPTINYTDGNWISGINYVDEKRLGPQDNLPDAMANNKARNRYYMLPLLLGVLGLVFHCVKSRKVAFVTFIMFFMTGLAIAIYLNMPPCQPRERDYAFVGSFYFFSVWIGLGVFALYEWLTTKFEKTERNYFLAISAVCILLGAFGGGWFVLGMAGVVGLIVSIVRLPNKIALPIAFVLSMSVPLLLAAQNWDDHDRSQKTAARDFAKNYLGLVDKNGIVITFGDNDTFPLWYIQEVEGWRTDVRILNYTLSGMHWYVEQLYNKLYESEPLPFTLPKEMYGLGHEIFYYQDGPRMEVTDALKMVANNQSQFVSSQDGELITMIPTNKFKITLDKAKLVANGIISQQLADSIPDVINFDVNIRNGRGNYMVRNEMMMPDILGTNRFERPISIMSPSYIRDVFPVVDTYSIEDGMLSLLVPYPVYSNATYTPRTKDYFLKGIRNDDGSYTPLEWGNLNKDIYIDPVSDNSAKVQRQSYVLLSNYLVANGDTASAKEALSLAEKFFPRSNFPADGIFYMVAYAYAHVGDHVNAYESMCDLFENSIQYINYLKSFPPDKAAGVKRQLLQHYKMIFNVAMLRHHEGFNPFTNRREDILTDEGEKAFIAADAKNADRLKAIDAFLVSSTFVNDIAPYFGGGR